MAKYKLSEIIKNEKMAISVKNSIRDLTARIEPYYLRTLDKLALRFIITDVKAVGWITINPSYHDCIVEWENHYDLNGYIIIPFEDVDFEDDPVKPTVQERLEMVAVELQAIIQEMNEEK